MAKKNASETSNLQTLHALMVDDSEDDVLLIIRTLKKGGYDPVYERVETAAAMKKALKEKQWDIVLCDYKMPKFNGLDAIALLKDLKINIPLIIISGTIGEETAIECMRSGAHDYIMKTNMSRLCPAIDRELEEVKIRERQKLAEELLHHSEEKYRTILDNMQEGYFEVDLAGNFTFVNNAMCRHFGYSKEEVLNVNYKDYTRDKEESKKVFQAFNKVYKTGEPINELIWQVIIKNEVKKHVAGSISLKKDASGTITGFTGIVRDITESREMEQKLRDEEHRFRTLAEQSSDIILLINRKGTIVYENKAVEVALGYKPEERIGSSSLDNMHPDDLQPNLDEFRKLFKNVNASILKTEIRLRHKDGSWRTFEEVASGLSRDNIVESVIVNLRDITERKKAEEALRKSERFFKEITENASDIIVITDETGIIKYCSPSIERFTGYTPEEVIGKDARTFIHPNEVQRATEEFDKSLVEGRKSALMPDTYRILHKDGSERYFHGTGKILLDNPDIAGVVINISDITERKKMEEKLRREEQIFRSVAEQSSDIIILISKEGTITYENPAAEKILGYTNEERVGRSAFELIHPDDVQTIIEASNVFLRNNKSSAGKVAIRFRHKNGSWRIFEVTAGNLLVDNVVESLVVNMQDITERKKAEEFLRQSEEKYRTILENMQEGYFEIDLTGNFTFVNHSACRDLGYSSEELIGMNNRKYTDEANAKKLFQAFNKVYKTGESLKGFHWQVIKKDGSIGDTEGYISLKKDSSGNPIGFTGVAHDITERRKAENALLESEKKYRNIFENAIEGIYQVTIEGKFITVNNAFARMAGYSSPEDLIDSINDIKNQLYVYPEDRDRFLRIMEEKNYVEGFEVEFYKKDGSTFWVVLSARAIKDEKGNILYNEGLMEDITLRKQAEENLNQSLTRLKKAVNTTIQVLVSALEVKDPYTVGHQVRSANLAGAIAAEMGLPQEIIDRIGMAGSIHDIGKISIPTELLSKPTKLTNIEFSLIKEHPAKGYEMLKDVEPSWPLAEIVYQHHERINGSGYPRNLKGSEILLEAKILAVADVVEAIASHRPYRPAYGIEVALEEIEKNKGLLYDETVANACLKLFRDKGYVLK